jgi:hypothetical protein
MGAAFQHAGRALAHLGGRGRLGERPALLHNPPGKNTPLVQTERRVSVKIHPGDLLGTQWLRHPSAPKEARMNNVVRSYH